VEKEGELSEKGAVPDVNHDVVNDFSVNALSVPDEEETQSLEMLVGSGKAVSQEEDTAWLGEEVLWGRTLEVSFFVNVGVGKLLDGAEACPVLPMVFPDTAVPLWTAVSFPLHGGPGACVLSRGLRMSFGSPV